MQASRHTQPQLYHPQVENPQTNRQENPMNRSSNQTATVCRQTGLVHPLQYWNGPRAGQRAVQTGTINIDNEKRSVDYEGCVARGVSCILTSKATCTSIFREIFAEDDSAKAKPEYSRSLKTIYEEDEEGD